MINKIILHWDIVNLMNDFSLEQINRFFLRAFDGNWLSEKGKEIASEFSNFELVTSKDIVKIISDGPGEKGEIYAQEVKKMDR